MKNNLIIKAPDPTSFCVFEPNYPGLKFSEKDYDLISLISKYIGDKVIVYRGIPGEMIYAQSQYTFTKNVIWIAISIYYSGIYNTPSEWSSMYKNLLSRALVFNALDDDHYNRILNGINSTDNNHILGIIISEIYNDKNAWTDLADPGLSQYRYEVAAERILASSKYKDISLICYSGRDYIKPKKEKLCDINMSNETYEVYLNKAADYLLDNISFKVADESSVIKKYIHGYSDVTHLFKPNIERTLAFRTNSDFGRIEHILNRLPDDGTLDPYKIYRSTKGEYYWILKGDTNTELIKLHLKKSYINEMRREGTDPKELLDTILPYMINGLFFQEVKINFLEVFVQAGEPSYPINILVDPDDTQLKILTNFMLEKANDGALYIIGIDNSLIPILITSLVIRPTSGYLSKHSGMYLLEGSYFRPEGQLLLDKMDQDDRLEFIVSDPGTDPMKGTRMSIVDLDMIKGHIKDNNNNIIKQGKINRDLPYLHEALNNTDITITSGSFKLGGTNLNNWQIEFSLGGIYAESSRLFNTIIHEIGGHLLNHTRWEEVDIGLNNDDMGLLKNCIKAYIDYPHDALYVDMTKDKVDLVKDLDDQMMFDLHTVDWDFIKWRESGEKITKEVVQNGSYRPLSMCLNFMQRHFGVLQNITWDFDMVKHYAVARGLRDEYGKTGAALLGVGFELDNAIKEKIASWKLNVTFNVTGGVGLDDLIANKAGYEGLSLMEAFKGGYLIHTEGINDWDYIGQGDWYQVSKNYIKLEMFNSRFFGPDISLWPLKNLSTEEISEQQISLEEGKVIRKVSEITNFIKTLDDLLDPRYKNYLKAEFISRVLSIMALRRCTTFGDIYGAMRLRYKSFSLTPEKVAAIEREISLILPGRIK